MLTAVISVLIGSIAGCLATLQVERVRARRNEAEMAEGRQRAEKRAFRLVERELDIAAQQIADAAAAGHYLGGDWQSLTLEWGEQRPVLAGSLGTGDWFRILAAYNALEDLQGLLERRLGSRGDPETIGQVVSSALVDAHNGRVREDDQLRLRWQAIRSAEWILRSYSGDAEGVDSALRSDELIARRLWGSSRGEQASVEPSRA